MKNKKVYDMVKEQKLIHDILNVIMGIGIILLLVFLFIYPNNRILLSVALCLGGFMNISNGFIHRKEKSKKITIFLLVLGVITIAAAIFIAKK